MDSRRRSISSRHCFVVPAVLAGLAVAVPLAAAAGPSLGYHRSAATVVASDRAEQLIQFVSEAARQLCGSQEAMAPNRPHMAASLPAAPMATCPDAPATPRPPTHVALPQFIALPPPIV